MVWRISCSRARLYFSGMAQFPSAAWHELEYISESLEKQTKMPQTSEQIVQAYLTRLGEIRSTGGATGETSYYSALETLLNAAGTCRSPCDLQCQLRSQGAGHPDFGLYNRNQCQKGEPKLGQGEFPERGVVEVKPLSDDTWQTAKGKQATKYFDRYNLVLVTNYRNFRLVAGPDTSGKPIEREFFSLAPDETTFWAVAAHPAKTAKERAAHFIEFLQRVLMNAAPLTKPEDVAWFLASYGRDALATLEAQGATALAPLRQALETALGVKFEGDKGEHFLGQHWSKRSFMECSPHG